MVWHDVHIDVVESLGLAKPGIQFLDLDANAHRSARSFKHTAAGGDSDCSYGKHDQDDQDQRSRPRLAMPFIKRRDRIGKNLQRERGSGLIHLPIPVDRKSTRLNSSHITISYAVFCLKKKN